MIRLSTEVSIAPLKAKISLRDRIVVLGSCFADSMGEKFVQAGFDAVVNPFGTLYNPVSIKNAIDRLDSGRAFSEKDCVEMGAGAGLICSYSHHTSFARPTAEDFLENANRKLAEAAEFWRSAGTVIVNFDSAAVWTLGADGPVVSNCLKRPSAEFGRKRLGAGEISPIVKDIVTAHSDKQFIFSISPIRHPGADGAHASTLSKAALHLGLDDALQEACNAVYFPSYEILLDELRDYRFYTEDLLHPNATAIGIIWERFSQFALKPEEAAQIRENEKRWRSSRHIEGFQRRMN